METLFLPPIKQRQKLQYQTALQTVRDVLFFIALIRPPPSIFLPHFLLLLEQNKALYIIKSSSTYKPKVVIEIYHRFPALKENSENRNMAFTLFSAPNIIITTLLISKARKVKTIEIMRGLRAHKNMGLFFYSSNAGTQSLRLTRQPELKRNIRRGWECQSPV